MVEVARQQNTRRSAAYSGDSSPCWWRIFIGIAAQVSALLSGAIPAALLFSYPVWIGAAATDHRNYLADPAISSLRLKFQSLDQGEGVDKLSFV